jgi:hypothetical protein
VTAGVTILLGFLGGMAIPPIITWMSRPKAAIYPARRIHKSARRRILAENRREIMKQKTGE